MIYNLAAKLMRRPFEASGFFWLLSQDSILACRKIAEERTVRRKNGHSMRAKIRAGQQASLLGFGNILWTSKDFRFGLRIVLEVVQK
jgi:hypothetical protein